MDRLASLSVVLGSYGTSMFALHRFRLYRRRKGGPPLELFRPFDHGSLLRELEPLDRLDGPRAALGTDRVALPPGGAWLELARRFEAGELDSAEVVLGRLEPGPRIDKHRAQLALRRAQLNHEAGRAVEAERWGRLALDLARMPGGRPDADAGSRYLLAYLRLWRADGSLLLEGEVFAVRRFLRRAIREVGPFPGFFLALAHAAALMGQAEQAVDELGRAVYYSRGDPFYRRLVLDSSYIAHARPALLAQVRAEGAGPAEATPEGLTPPAAGR